MEQNTQQKVIIIGAGIGGLALGTLLIKKGYDVTIIEKNEMTGGRMRIFEASGFRFDMGPSWYMMPDVFEHFFNLIGEKYTDYYTLKKLSPSYQVTLKSNKQQYLFYSELEKNIETFETIEPGSGPVLRSFLDSTKMQYEIAYNEFMFKNYNSVFDFINKRTMTLGAKLPIFQKHKHIIEKQFHSELLQKVLEYQTILLGTSPSDTPGIYSLMNYVDFVLGEWYPEGGMRSIPDALEKIFRNHGGKILLDTEVSKIMIENNTATGVLLKNGEVVNGAYVVSNADVHFTDTVLLDKPYAQFSKKYWDKRTLAPSAFILYLGVIGKIDTMAHHSLLFSKDWDKNFRDIFKDHVLPQDPALYICVPSKTDSTVAPENHENLFVLVPTPPGVHLHDEEKKTYRDFVIKEISTYYNIPDLASRIVYERIYTATDFETDYYSHKGTALGLAHTLTQTAVWRPNNVHKKIDNLLYVGAGTNPGIGVPICLISAELAYKRIRGITSPHPLTEL